jgi:hypothetical protein
VASSIRRQHVACEFEHPVELPNQLLAPKGHHLCDVRHKLRDMQMHVVNAGLVEQAGCSARWNLCNMSMSAAHESDDGFVHGGLGDALRQP